jgi:transcriptional regulator NrdR family protein
MSKQQIKCKRCHAINSVINTIHYFNGLPIEYDRLCFSCGETFKTTIKYEVIETVA